MPKYRFEASYTAHGEEGLRSKGGTDRRDAVADAVHSVGGELESFYFEFGEHDVFFDRRSSRRRSRRSRFPDRHLRMRSDGEDDRAAHTPNR